MNIDTANIIELTPSSFLSRRVAVLGTTGSGKSNTVAVLLEELLPHLPFAIVDPHGEYYTLRERFDVLIVGKSDNADQQISASQAGAVALWSYRNRKSVILDLYKIVDEDERLEYVFEFCNAIWQYSREIALGGHQPYGVVLEEAHNFIPESMTKDARIKILHTFANEGRKFGFLMIASTQRASKVSKDYLATCDYRLFHRVSDAPDVKAYHERLTYSLQETKRVAMGLATGQAIFRTASAQQIIQVRQRFTRHVQANVSLSEENKPALLPIDGALLEELKALLTKPEVVGRSPVPSAPDDPVAPVADPELQRLRDELAAMTGALETAQAALTAAQGEVDQWKARFAQVDVDLRESRMENQRLNTTIKQLRKGKPEQLPLMKPEGPEVIHVAEAEGAQVTLRERMTTQTTTVEREFIGEHVSSRTLTLRRNRQQKKFDDLIAALVSLYPLHRRALGYCMDHESFVHIATIAAALDYDAVALQKRMHALDNLGLVVQRARLSKEWRSNVDPFMRTQFPDLNTQVLMERLWALVTK